MFSEVVIYKSGVLKCLKNGAFDYIYVKSIINHIMKIENKKLISDKLTLEKFKVVKLKNTIVIKGGLGSKSNGCPTRTEH
ncbi:hypothetical protein GCM10022259_03430 [Aquimarina mytili]